MKMLDVTKRANSGNILTLGVLNQEIAAGITIIDDAPFKIGDLVHLKINPSRRMCVIALGYYIGASTSLHARCQWIKADGNTTYDAFPVESLEVHNEA